MLGKLMEIVKSNQNVFDGMNPEIKTVGLTLSYILIEFAKLINEKERLTRRNKQLAEAIESIKQDADSVGKEVGAGISWYTHAYNTIVSRLDGGLYEINDEAKK
jgi:adenosyl cobinamide kinase/adenosyl cobinamide phosphate guanylyltransferase